MNYHHRHVWPVVRKSVRKTYRRPLRVLADEPMGPHKRQHHRRVYSHREPIPLLHGGTGQTVAYACGTCGTVRGGKRHGLAHAKEAAVRCCLWRDRCSGCGREVDRQKGKCTECWSRQSFERVRNLARKARIVEDNGEPVCCEQFSGSWGEGYSHDLASHLEAWEEERGGWANTGEADDVWIVPPPPPFVFATTPCVPEVSQEQIDESMLDELHEDFDITDLPGHAELCDAVERFNAAQGPASYMVDYTRVIVLDPVRFAAYLEETWSGTPDVNYRRRFDPAKIPVYQPRPASEIAAEAAARESDRIHSRNVCDRIQREDTT